MSGLKPIHIPELAALIKNAYEYGDSEQLQQQALDFIRKVKG